MLKFKKTNYISLNQTAGARVHKQEDIPKMEESLWMKCDCCGEMLLKEDVKKNKYMCYKCGKYFRLRAKTRIKLVADKDTFDAWDNDLETTDPLNFPDYAEKIEQMQKKCKISEAVTTGKCMINGKEAVVCACDGRFMMASMGYVVGEKITRAVERATAEKLPVIIFACSGGARMQEGMVSLMQMAKTSAALKKHSDAGLFYLSVLTDPTTGGVTASFAMLGDVILAEPGALIGFAGPRVIEQTIRQKLPEGFQRAEFLVEHGLIDGIIYRENMKETIAKLIDLYDKDRIAVKPEKSDPLEAAERAALIKPVSNTERARQVIENEVGKAKAVIQSGKDILHTFKENGTEAAALTAWERVEIARGKNRPTALDYIEKIFTGFYELHGDRRASDDGAIIGGVAYLNGVAVTVIGQQKGRNTKENLIRNFGMPSPEGYIKALRLMKQAEKFNRPIIAFIDTPGAFCGMEAEEHGQGQAIATNLFEMAGITVPIVSIVIGEGGSGGALALGVGNEVWMMENATYSVLSPEGFASILWKDSRRAPEAAEVMKMVATDLKELDIIDDIIPEPEPACAENLSYISHVMKHKMVKFVNKYKEMSREEIVADRQKRFRNM